MKPVDERSVYTAVTRVAIKDMLQWQKERRSKVKDLTVRIPAVDQLEKEYIQSNRTEPAISFVGHSTFLIQIGGLNLITDPVWAQRMGFGKRMNPPGMEIADLPKIDMVLISHNHYDHLHYGSIRKLRGNPVYYVPHGLSRSFQRKGFRQVQEFDWWDSITYKGLRLTFIPALHWSRRTLWDTNRSLWGGWMIEHESTGKTVYFVGDTGYHEHFCDIGEQFAIDYVLMPIGAYEPEWFMHKQHVTPEEAVQAFGELGAKHMIPMHYDAYHLADDTPQEALERLYQRWDEVYTDRQRLHVLKCGETYRLRFD